MAPKIPDRWLPYKPFGEQIEGTQFVSFKVPLQRTVQGEIWDVQTLLQSIPNLGYVIDLTNSRNYYDPQLLERKGVRHRKILCPGLVIPQRSIVTRFFEAVDEYLSQNDGKIIGVHCTHGLNRTGYFVCSYMRDRLGIPVDVAITRFETARGYRIERANFLADLRGQSSVPMHRGSNVVIRPVEFPRVRDAHRVADTLSWRSNKNRKRKLEGSRDNYTHKYDYAHDY